MPRTDRPAEAVASPCNLVCTIDPTTGWCLGCGRTLAEIAEWGLAEPVRKLSILEDLNDRKRKLAEGPR